MLEQRIPPLVVDQLCARIIIGAHFPLQVFLNDLQLSSRPCTTLRRHVIAQVIELWCLFAAIGATGYFDHRSFQGISLRLVCLMIVLMLHEVAKAPRRESDRVSDRGVGRNWFEVRHVYWWPLARESRGILHPIISRRHILIRHSHTIRGFTDFGMQADAGALKGVH